MEQDTSFLSDFSLLVKKAELIVGVGALFLFIVAAAPWQFASTQNGDPELQIVLTFKSFHEFISMTVENNITIKGR